MDNHGRLMEREKCGGFNNSVLSLWVVTHTAIELLSEVTRECVTRQRLRKRVLGIA